jgi:hypothetical protein
MAFTNNLLRQTADIKMPDPVSKGILKGHGKYKRKHAFKLENTE